ncbi:MAG: hypothetical protein ABIP50_00245 [Candidatus Saccharimonadales bacterium]
MGNRSHGFTIIETMLFLGISGILIVSLLAGTGATIGIQRYKDSVETFKSFLQGQYAELSSVRNGRDSGWTCDANGSTIATSIPTDGVPVGQSDCELVGRYVTIVDSDITAYSVTARKLSNPPAAVPGDTDVSKMANSYNYNLASDTKDDSQLEWGARIAWPTLGQGSKPSGSSRSIAMLFIRSPETGVTYTFTSDIVPADPSPTTLKAMIVAGVTAPGKQGSRTLCIDSNGSILGSDQSIYIYAAASGPSSVETRSNAYIDGLTGTRGDGQYSLQC